MTAKEKHLMKQLDKVRAENKELRIEINEVKKSRYNTETLLLQANNKLRRYEQQTTKLPKNCDGLDIKISHPVISNPILDTMLSIINTTIGLEEVIKHGKNKNS